MENTGNSLLSQLEQRELRATAQGVLALTGFLLLTVTVLVIFLTASGRSKPSASTATGSSGNPPPSARLEANSRKYDGKYAVGLQGTVRQDFRRNRPPPAGSGRYAHAVSPAGKGARIAIVIDDIGHNIQMLKQFLDLRRPLSYAILPAVTHAMEAAKLIGGQGREYIIHLPMQPFDYPQQNPGPLPLLLSLTLEETADRVRSYMTRLPGATGASNHMGSAYTYDEDRMRVVQTVLDERKKYFLNSRTSAASTPREIAQKWGYAYLERDIFLDHVATMDSISEYFDRAVRKAKIRGNAIAIGHPYPETVRVLRRRLPQLKAQGVKLVSLSDLFYP